MSEPWIKLQRNLPRHPRAAEAGASAMWLYIGGLTYCDEFATDGRIPSSAIYGLTNANRQSDKDAAQLVKVGLWSKDGDDFVVERYLEHNRSAAEIKEQEAKRSVAGKYAAGVRWASVRDANRMRPAYESHAKGDAKQMPVLEVERDIEEKTLKTMSLPAEGDLSSVEHPKFFDETFWPNYPCQNWPAQPNPKPGKAQAKAQWARLSRAEKSLAWGSLPHYKAYLELTGQQTKHCERYLKQKAFNAYQSPPTPPPERSKGRNASNFDAVVQKLGVNDEARTSPTNHEVPQRGLPEGRVEPGTIRALG